jgi:voltage-gated sodium channel
MGWIVRLRNHAFFERFIISVIILAGILVGLETSPELVERHGDLLHLLDKIILGIFVVEIVIKILAERPKYYKYFLSGWNLFDFSIVVVCLLPIGSQWVAVVRLARILRTARLITQIPNLQILIGALLRSIPSMFFVSLLLGLQFYIYAVMATFLFRGNDPGHFGNLGMSMVSLFRVVTLEDWTDIMYTAYYGSHIYPAQGPIPVGPDPQAHGIAAIFFFLSFVIIGAMVMINLFVGVMIQSLSKAESSALRKKLHLEQIEQQDKSASERIASIEKELAELKRGLGKNLQD